MSLSPEQRLNPLAQNLLNILLNFWYIKIRLLLNSGSVPELNKITLVNR
jgi:hypothetical protein